MDFNLKKDIIFFDVESTGLNVIRDRILQIALIKYTPGSSEPEELTFLINPGIPISQESYNVHGISAQDVANKPTFAQVADQIFDFIGDGDLGGYNSARFDIPILMEEFARVGKELSMEGRNNIDVQRIFYKMEPRTLRAALRFYCGKELMGAHDALADVRATVDVLKGQLDKYEGVDLKVDEVETVKAPIVNDMDALHKFTSDLKTIDATQRLKYDAEGKIIFNFGKYVNQPVVDVILKDKNYYNWIINKDFSSQVKQIIKRLYQENA
jgi:DNA polymerase-3 subunit epsilon